MSKINEFFLKAIFKEKEIEEDDDIVTAISEMSKFLVPKLLSDENNYALYYSVKFDDLKELEIDETQAFALRQQGWVMDEKDENIIKTIG